MSLEDEEIEAEYAHTKKLSCEDTGGKHHLQAKEEVSTKANTADTLILDFSLQSCGKINSVA